MNAEGSKQAAILTAEGERQAAILRAEGFALALPKINEVARRVDANTMSLQYLDALKQIGASPSSKIVVPMELSGLVAGVRRGRRGSRRRATAAPGSRAARGGRRARNPGARAGVGTANGKRAPGGGPTTRRTPSSSTARPRRRRRRVRPLVAAVPGSSRSAWPG